MAPELTCDARVVLFDFFGTLVEYQPDRSHLGSPRSHQLACSLGYQHDHDAFVAMCDSASKQLEHSARQTLREFSMTDAAIAFSTAARLHLSAEAADELGQTYVAEWARHLTPIAGVADMILGLAERRTIAIVSNTHDRNMVPDLLEKMRIVDEFSAVVLSVEHGRLKPHPSIYATALDLVGCAASDAVFVGDSHEADYAAPRRFGMSALLIDPAADHDIEPQHRLASVLDVTAACDDGPNP